MSGYILIGTDKDGYLRVRLNEFFCGKNHKFSSRTRQIYTAFGFEHQTQCKRCSCWINADGEAWPPVEEKA